MSAVRRIFIASLLATPLAALSAEPVDINTADAATLAAAIKGVGEEKAKAIVEYREKHGPFKSVEDLVLVPGIGEKTVAANRDKLTVSSPEGGEASGGH